MLPMRHFYWLTCVLLACGTGDGGSDQAGGAGAGSGDARRPGLLGGGEDTGNTPTPGADALPSFADSAPAGDATPNPDAARPNPDEGVLRLTPDRVTLIISDGAPPPSVTFRLERIGVPGGPVAIPANTAVFSVDPPNLGAVDAGGIFTSSGLPGLAQVSAEHGGDTALALVDIQDIGSVIEPGTPPDAADRFMAAPERPGCAPTYDYPEPLTVLPSNIGGLTFQWAARGHDLFELTFQTPNLVVRWYTIRNEVTPSGDAWTAILNDSAGDRLHVTLSGLGGAGDEQCRSEPLPLIVDRGRLVGAIYYWSTGDVGIMRIALGETRAEPFLTPVTAPEINCPACHALSRDGKRIALTRTTFPPFGNLFVSDIDAPRMPYFDPANKIGYFPSFDPSGEMLVAGNGGQLVITSSTTGAEIERLPMPARSVGGSPDWAWNADKIVAAHATNGINPIPDVGIQGGAISQWLKEGGAWGQPSALVPQEDGVTNDRPAYSPDGTWVAFQRSGGEVMNGMGMGDASNSLWIIPSAGGMPPRELTAANQRPGLGNSWPKWAPTSGGGRMWLAFSSMRSYGHLLSQNGGEGSRPQLWVTGIDPDAAPGNDPSAPAFWLPYQNLESGNHIPYWAFYEKR